MSSDPPRQTACSAGPDSYLVEYDEFSEAYLGRQLALRVQRNQVMEAWEDSYFNVTRSQKPGHKLIQRDEVTEIWTDN